MLYYAYDHTNMDLTHLLWDNYMLAHYIVILHSGFAYINALYITLLHIVEVWAHCRIGSCLVADM